MGTMIEFIKKQREFIYLLICAVVYLGITSVLNITCPIKLISGISCPGCGMTRALKSLLLLDFNAAFNYHPLVFALIPMAIILLVLSVKRKFKIRSYAIYIISFIFIVVYLYRLIFTETVIVVFEPENGLIYKLLNLLF